VQISYILNTYISAPDGWNTTAVDNGATMGLPPGSGNHAYAGQNPVLGSVAWMGDTTNDIQDVRMYQTATIGLIDAPSDTFMLWCGYQNTWVGAPAGTKITGETNIGPYKISANGPPSPSTAASWAGDKTWCASNGWGICDWSYKVKDFDRVALPATATTPTNFSNEKHSGGTNYAFVDGHVKWLDQKSVPYDDLRFYLPATSKQ
jgi:prepilin-type processing-associated H-X9-DG protein